MFRLAILTTILCGITASGRAAPPQILVKPLTGESITARLLTLTPASLSFQAGAQAKTFSTADLQWLEFPSSEPALDKPAVWIELLDGSKLLAVSYTALAGKAQIALASGLTVEVPTRSIRHVRFRQQSTPELASQWREIVSSQATGDLVVIRKTVDRATDADATEPSPAALQSLDQLEGTVLDVGPDSVQFEFDGERINIRREKLDGLVYFHPVKREFSPPLCRLSDTGGSTWLLRDLLLTETHLATNSLGGIAVEWPLAAVTKIDFSVGNIVALTELEPDSGGTEPVISLQPAGMANKFGRVFQIRGTPPLGAEAFRIGGTRFDSGVSLHSPLKLVYRVPAGFRWFRAVAGVDDSIAAPGRFDLVVQGDGQELLRHPFSGESSSSRVALPVHLDVSKIRRLTIILDPVDGQDIGDQLNLCEARFTK